MLGNSEDEELAIDLHWRPKVLQLEADLAALRAGYDTVMHSLEDADADLAALRAACQALAGEIAATETTVASKGDVDFKVCVLDPMVIKRWADQLARLSAAPAAEPPHEHHYKEFTMCTECGRTEAAIEGCHHCNEVTVGKRCWWCLTVRLARLSAKEK